VGTESSGKHDNTYREFAFFLSANQLLSDFDEAVIEVDGLRMVLAQIILFAFESLNDIRGEFKKLFCIFGIHEKLSWMR
jgi:hypothetical protein